MKLAQVYPLLVVLLAVFAIAPLEYPGTFQSHTGLTATYNLIHLAQNPSQLGWAPTFGSFFDVFRTDGILPYAIAYFFHLIGFSFLDSIKLVYALAWIQSGLGMYALARKFSSAEGSLIAALVYIYLPYHIATVYVRGAFAEAVAWALYPISLFALSQFANPKSKFKIQNSIFAILVFALLFLTQPGIAILFTVVAILATLMFTRSTSSLAHSLIRSFGGLFLGALLTLPAIFRNGLYISLDAFNAYFVYPFQLFASLWGNGISTGSFPPQGLAVDQFPFQIGVVPIGLAMVALALGWRQAIQANTTAQRLVVVAIATTIILSILTFEITKPLWNILGLFVAYPWQLLAFVGFFLALAAGAVIEFDERFKQPGMLILFIALPIVASYGYLAPASIQVNPTRPAIALFNNNEIAMLDYRIVGPLRHGATLRIEVTWQALRPVDYDYTIFVHAVNEDGKTYGETDIKPKEGALPTLKWTTGQVITDTYTIQIDVDGPREGYHLEFGMYKPNGTRAIILETGADTIVLPRPGDPEPIESDQLPPPKSK